MGAESTSGSGESNETQVVQNVYDLTPINNYTYLFGLGIFHSGIEVHGKEYGFGAHNFPVSGVFEVEPRNCPGFLYRNSIRLGKISMPPSEFRTFIEDMASEYHGDTYHLISKNCNHFTDDVSWRLTGRHVPGWVNRLARLGALCSCLLPESLQVTPVKQLSEYHKYSGKHPRLLSPLAMTKFETDCQKQFNKLNVPHDISDQDATESISNTTPMESPEVYDTYPEKHLLSPPSGSGEVVFVKEGRSDS